MKTISDWNDLKEYGIQFLTGERCGYSMRILCDLNEDGKKLIESFFCMKVDENNWNNTVNGKPAVASVMIPYDLFKQLATYCLFHVGNYAMVIYSGGSAVTGITRKEWGEHGHLWENMTRKSNFCYKEDPSICRNGLNVHQMSGR